jgi:broad specificity phosphatase PhoE
VEWAYGDYEGLRTAEIKQLRGQRDLNAKDFDVFKHGCEGGEYVDCWKEHHVYGLMALDRLNR